VAWFAIVSNNLGEFQTSVGFANAFVPITQTTKSSFSISKLPSSHPRIGSYAPNNERGGHSTTSTRTFATVATVPIIEAVTTPLKLTDYAPAATNLFNNLKLPASIVTAGMISLGFATSFPVLPQLNSNNKPFSAKLRARCESLQRLHIVVALISITNELVVVLWAAVEVNQLTERQFAPASSVWALLQRDCDLAWSAVNSHYVVGIIGFVTMLALRAYVSLLASEASMALMTAASTGTGAALCLCLSIVNRGVESGGGDGYRYGNTILDLLGHYAQLLFQTATSEISPGPLQLLAIVLELTSLVFLANVLIFQNGKIKYDNDSEKENGVIDVDHQQDNNDNPLLAMASVVTKVFDEINGTTDMMDAVTNAFDRATNRSKEITTTDTIAATTNEQQQSHSFVIPDEAEITDDDDDISANEEQRPFFANTKTSTKSSSQQQPQPIRSIDEDNDTSVNVF